MKKKIMVMIAILFSLISFSGVMRARFTDVNREIQRFSTENEEFSDEYDLVVPEIRIVSNKMPELFIRFVEKGKTNSFRKIEIVSDSEKISYNFTDEQVRIDFTADDKAVLYTEKGISLDDADKIFDMISEEKSVKINFINNEKGTITKELNKKEKEILKWTILNYYMLLIKK